MQFVNPSFLYGLFALAIPLIIHLFNFRRFRKVWFTNVKLLEEFTQKTRRESKIRHLLVLILRMLAITMLVMAFAQPYIPAKDAIKETAGSKAYVSVYIDNSFSMESGSSDGTLIENAKRKAVEIAMSFKTGDVFNLVTNDFEGKHQRMVSRDEFVELVSGVNISSSVRSLSEVLQRQYDILGNEDLNKYTFWVSDFQKAICDFGNLPSNNPAKLFVVPLLPSGTANLYIDTAWLSSPVLLAGQAFSITAVVKNSSDVDVEKVPLKLSVNGAQRAIASIDIKGGGEAEVNMTFSLPDSGIQHGYLEITDSPINYDDRLYFSFNVGNSIPVVCIYGKNTKNFINSLYGLDSAFFYKSFSEKMIDYAAFPGANLIILDGVEQISSGLAQELKKFIGEGGSVAIFPAGSPDLSSYNDLLTSMEMDYFLPEDTFNTKITDINLGHPLFNEVFDKIPDNINLPVVNSYFPLTSNMRSGREVLLGMQNSSAFLSVQQFMKGKVYLFASPLETSFTNFPRHAIFVPVMYRIALLVAPERSLYYFTGKEEYVPLKSSAQGTDLVFKIKHTESDFEVIPGIRESVGNIVVSTYGQIKEAGNYNLILDKSIIAGLAFNYDRRESQLEYFSQAELIDGLSKVGLKDFNVLKSGEGNISKTITQLKSGTLLWKIFVLLALLCLLGEIMLLRLGK